MFVMSRISVAVHRFKQNSDTIKKAVISANVFEHLPVNARVIIKPNIVIWLDSPYPK
jgi:hypothetical protein